MLRDSIATVADSVHVLCNSSNNIGMNSNSNPKTLILKDSSVRSIWTYLTASPSCTTAPHTSIISTMKVIRVQSLAQMPVFGMCDGVDLHLHICLFSVQASSV